MRRVITACAIAEYKQDDMTQVFSWRT